MLFQQTLEIGDDGKVMGIRNGLAPDAKVLHGLVTPGFVNAHCHLELSHLAGKIPRHTGMAGFVVALQPLRDQFSAAEKSSAIESALAEMRAGGIIAIGDICNGTDTLPHKQAHPEFLFHNFIELFGLNPAMAEEIFFRGLELLKEFGRHSSITPHAPYSMSVALRDKVLGYAKRREWPQSIHFLESQEERQLFEELDGPLMAFIRGIGAVFQAHTYKTATAFVTDSLPLNCNVLLVHNTEITSAELESIVSGWPRAFFVLCPLANRYIHDRLPAAAAFARYPDRVCLGTDSLAGNDRLSILAEMQVLQEAYRLPSETLLRWATLNGAIALGLDPSKFQVFEGANPTLIHVADFKGGAFGIPSHSPIQYLNL